MNQELKNYLSNQELITSQRQLSGLFSIISNNLLIAMEILNRDHKIETITELEILSKKAKMLSEELNSDHLKLTEEEIYSRVSSLKHRMLELIIDLSDELTSKMSNESASKKDVENIILARRLLRDSRRGLATVRD